MRHRASAEFIRGHAKMRIDGIVHRVSIPQGNSINGIFLHRPIIVRPSFPTPTIIIGTVGMYVLRKDKALLARYAIRQIDHYPVLPYKRGAHVDYWSMELPE